MFLKTFFGKQIANPATHRMIKDLKMAKSVCAFYLKMFKVVFFQRNTNLNISISTKRFQLVLKVQNNLIDVRKFSYKGWRGKTQGLNS